MKSKKILILAPHTDDGELGCGATISKLIREGNEVHYVAFSTCENSLPEGYPNGTLKNELFNAIKSLKIPSENITVFNYEVRNFTQNRQQILDDLIVLNKKILPDIVFMPSIKDIHQDHNTIAIEGLRAFKKTTIMCYEVPWNNFSFDNQVFSCIDEVDVINKINALKCYKSQENRPYLSEEFIRSLLITHGVQIGEKYAEVFEIPRLILK